MIDPCRTAETDRRDATDRETGEVVDLSRARSADVGRARDGRQPAEVDPIVAGDEAQHRLEPGRPWHDEEQRLHDLAEVRSDRGCRFGRGVGRLIEGDDLEGHALPGGRIEHALDRGMDGGVGHAGESSIGPGRRAAA